MKGKALYKAATVILAVVVLIVAVFIMARGLGLVDGLDFGAGSYYYADIPDFDKYLKWDSFTTSIPYRVYALLFIAWGIIFYLVWKRLDK